jgi:hypothetical protein
LSTHIAYKYVRCFNFGTSDAMIFIEACLAWAIIIILQRRAMKTKEIGEKIFSY